MKSKITGGETTFLFNANILGKYPVGYYRCNDTGFIQTENVYWLDEAYSSAITSLDIGLPMRNNNNAAIIGKVIDKSFDYNGKFLDVAGGYGLFTRLMRDKGFNFFHTDVYCQNLFANYFTLDDLMVKPKFEAVTVFEAFEHFNSPLEEISDLFKYSDSVFFSTEIIPDKSIKDSSDWWYFVPETGQHIAFYTIEALQHIAKLNGVNFYSNGTSLHLFTKKELSKNPFDDEVIKKDSLMIRAIKKILYILEKNKIEQKAKQIPIHPSLLQKDLAYILTIISTKEKQTN